MHLVVDFTTHSMVERTRASNESVMREFVSTRNWWKVVQSIEKACWEWLLDDCNVSWIYARVQQAKSEAGWVWDLVHVSCDSSHCDSVIFRHWSWQEQVVKLLKCESLSRVCEFEWFVSFHVRDLVWVSDGTPNWISDIGWHLIIELSLGNRVNLINWILGCHWDRVITWVNDCHCESTYVVDKVC